MALVIKKWGNSNAIRLPQTVLDNLNWEANQELDFVVTDDALTLKSVTKKKDVKDLFAGFEGKISGSEVNWGVTQGGEVW